MLPSLPHTSVQLGSWNHLWGPGTTCLGVLPTRRYCSPVGTAHPRALPTSGYCPWRKYCPPGEQCPPGPTAHPGVLSHTITHFLTSSWLAQCRGCFSPAFWSLSLQTCLQFCTPIHTYLFLTLISPACFLPLWPSHDDLTKTDHESCKALRHHLVQPPHRGAWKPKSREGHGLANSHSSGHTNLLSSGLNPAADFPSVVLQTQSSQKASVSQSRQKEESGRNRIGVDCHWLSH